MRSDRQHNQDHQHQHHHQHQEKQDPPVSVQDGGADGALQVTDGRVDVGGGGERGPVVRGGGTGHQQGGRPGGRGSWNIHVSATTIIFLHLKLLCLVLWVLNISRVFELLYLCSVSVC